MALRKLALMHKQFGQCEGHICGECSNLISGKYRGRSLRKCRVYGLTHSEASDWAKSWATCGIFNGTYTGRPIIELVKSGNDGGQPLENQISMLDEKGGADNALLQMDARRGMRQRGLPIMCGLLPVGGSSRRVPV